MNIVNRIETICDEALKLKNKYISESGLLADWVCIFAKSENDYIELVHQAHKIGKEIEAVETGTVFRLIREINTVLGTPKVLKVRKYDSTRPEMGDVDLTTKYKAFKRKYEKKSHFKLIVRDKFEMLELMDFSFNVRIYFSSIRPSKLRGIK